MTLSETVDDNFKCQKKQQRNILDIAKKLQLKIAFCFECTDIMDKN